MVIPAHRVGADPRERGAASIEDGLLRPTLTSDFDVRAFRWPCEPRHLLWSGFLGGPLAGGALVAWNHWRMNQPRSGRWVVLLTLVFTLGFSAAAGWWMQTHGFDASRTQVRIAQRALGAGLVLALVPAQKKRFDAYERAGLEPGKLLWPSLVAILGLGSLQGALTEGVYRWLAGSAP